MRKITALQISNNKLPGALVDQWRNSGYAFVHGILPDDKLNALCAAARGKFPSPGSEQAARIKDFGSFGSFNFPSETAVFNEITLDENLLTAVAELLDVAVEELRLTQSDLWPKYGPKYGQPKSNSDKKSVQDNSDQRIHVDYPNHTLAHPSPWHSPEAVEMIIYLSDCADTGGGTALVPRQGDDDELYPWPIIDSPGIGDLRYINDRQAAEDYFAEARPERAAFRQKLYAREVTAQFSKGDILFYRHDAWHRGTPMIPGTLRLVVNLTYRKAEAEWISTLHVGWAWKAYRDNKFLERLIASSSLKQRAVLGFPQPGNKYWNKQTIEAVEARYGMFGMDMTPYREAHAKEHLVQS